MKKALFSALKPFNSEIVFDPNSPFNSDGLLDALINIKKKFANHSIDLQAQSFNINPDFTFYLFSDMPRVEKKLIDKEKSYLILLETDLIRPDNWVIEDHKYFKKIFTWNEDWVDNKKYFKYNCSRSGETDFLSFNERSGLCTMISGNKMVKHPLELYSLRYDFIKYFEKKANCEFHFYGKDWDKYFFRGHKLIRALNRVKWLQKILAPKFNNYRGLVDRKLDTLKKYKFSLCFENGKDLPNGHVTEKIFDSIAAGCIPIYYGAHNITDYVPESCFVDYRKFNSKDELFMFMKSMSEDTFNSYLTSMKLYLNSDEYKKFTPEFNAEVVVSEILKDIV